MKRLIACAFSMMLATAAFSAIDYANPTISIAISGAQFAAASSLSSVGIRSVGVNPANGHVIIWDAGDSSTADGRLWDVDVSGVSPAFTLIATEAQILAGTGGDSGGTLTVNDQIGGIVVHPTNGKIYFNSFQNNDDIIEITPGVTPTVVNIHEENGMNGITLNAAGTHVVFGRESTFGATEDQLAEVAIAGGAVTVISTKAQLTAANGGTDGGLNAPLVGSSGNILVFSESSFGGNDNIMSVTEAGVITANHILGSSFPGGAPGIGPWATDANGALYMWNEFSAGGAEVTVREPGGAFHQFTQASLVSTLSIPQFDGNTNGFAAHVVSPTEVVAFFASYGIGSSDRTVGDDNLVRFKFIGPSSVNDWILME